MGLLRKSKKTQKNVQYKISGSKQWKDTTVSWLEPQ